MRLEPLTRQSDWVSLTAVICGVAPLPLALLSLLPLVGCLASPVLLLSIPGAIGFGVAGLVRARAQPEPNYVQPLTGLVLGFTWAVLFLVGLVFLSRSGFRLPNLPGL